jgi:protein-disulfide isomerase
MSKELRNLILIFVAVLIAGFLFYKFALSDKVAETTQKQNTPAMTAPMIGNLAASHSYSVGPIDAKVTVVEFFDPECESCAAVAPYIKNEMKYYEGKVRWVFRYMPYHHNSKTAIRVLEAARKQNQFLETMTLLFEQQKQWGERKESTEKEILQVISANKSLDLKQLQIDMKNPAIDEIITKDETEGTAGGVEGTPTFFINGVRLEKLDLDLMIKRINEILQ